MTGRDPNSIGMVILIGGVIVAVVGPLLSSTGSGDPKGIAFNWYVIGGLAILVGACILLR